MSQKQESCTYNNMFLINKESHLKYLFEIIEQISKTFLTFSVQNYEETCELPSWLIDPKHLAGTYYENLNGTRKYHLKSNSLTVTTKHDQSKEAFGGNNNLNSNFNLNNLKPRMSLECNSVEQSSEIKKFARLVMQVNFDW